MRLESGLHLTYCTNVHPGETWADTLEAVRRHAPELKRRLAPDRPFGVGLRLSGLASAELLDGDELDRFADFLEEHGLYVAVINGFPYGAFHGTAVKARVHAPDWRDEERVLYTLRLARVLERILPDGLDGGISTSPLSYGRWIPPGDRSARERMTLHVARVAEALARVRAETGRLVHLDLEPEPDGLLESGAEVVTFFEDWLLPAGAPVLADRLGLSRAEAEALLLEHVRVCLDACHFAVGFEELAAELARFARAGVRVGRLQASSALRVPLDGDRAALARRLEPFAESTYLHQVVERRDDGSLRRFPDLAEALPRLADPGAREWRVHFHVPLFVKDYAGLGSTQADLSGALGLLRQTPFARHVEIETYTWDVLPPDLKRPLLDSVEREYRWVLEKL